MKFIELKKDFEKVNYKPKMIQLYFEKALFLYSIKTRRNSFLKTNQTLIYQ